ncbi:armadillo-type protein [Xylariales sp. PMI_506]|nr:armadillo-type protein [Xylariales sp. PMI_506]
MAAEVSLQLNGSPAERLAGLRTLKNEVVGHAQKKEQWLRAGILPTLVALLDSDHDAKLPALQLLASFASAGPAYLCPLYAADALPAVLNCLQHEERPQIVLAALRVVRDVADSCILAPSSPINPDAFADLIFENPHLAAFTRILALPDSSRNVAAQVSIVAKLISTLCREERHQHALVNCGALDALATRLASFAVAEGQVIPGAETISRLEGLSEFIPGPAKTGIKLSDILGAVGAIITDSGFRACRLLYSPSILAVFPITDSEHGLSSLRTDPLELAGLRPTRQKEGEPMDLLLLPYLPSQVQSSSTVAFPPLGTTGSRGTSRISPSWATIEEGSGTEEVDEAESPLIPWLIGLVRTREDTDAVMAASVLTSLYKNGFTYKSRETTLGLLVIPKLLHLLAEATEADNHHASSGSQDDETASRWFIIEQIPAILARLITDSDPVQKAAVESNAVKTLCKLLKTTYDTPPPMQTPQAWSPSEDVEQSMANSSPDSQLGEHGQHPLLTHRIRVRESVLKALGALASFKEDYRKAIIDQDIIPYIVESMNPTPHRPKQAKAINGNEKTIEIEESSEFGSNPSMVLIAACYALRMVSRSVAILRTSLVDHGAAMPCYSLLRHADLEVQIAATAAVCNLLADFSPMRESLTRAGVLKVLCDHARSHSAPLRLNALWALKQLVHQASVELKKQAVEELQSGWLVQLICDDTEDEAVFSARARSEDDDMDIDDQARLSFSRTLSNKRISGDSRIIRLADARLTTLREAELNPIRKARQEDLAIQEQGLAFIRNLVGDAYSNGTDSVNDTAEMVDFLFGTLGQDRFFNILASKLKVKVLHAFSGRRGTTGGETRILYPQTKIIESVIYILVHVAASVPRHRQLVIAQTELLKLLAGLFNSQDSEVRVALCHLLNNLTWMDSDSDKPGSMQRALELKKLGFLTKLESLGQDEELDVRERAKPALHQIHKAC